MCAYVHVDIYISTHTQHEFIHRTAAQVLMYLNKKKKTKLTNFKKETNKSKVQGKIC